LTGYQKASIITLTTTTGTAMKTNKELNTAYDARQKDKVRPGQPVYEFKALEAVIRSWITGNK
jgi:hypothetical protein